jgi:hypothetical protein
MPNQFKKSSTPPSPTSKINSTKRSNAKKYHYNNIFLGIIIEKNLIQRIYPIVEEKKKSVTQID